jgi:uncharacterized membrane protein
MSTPSDHLQRWREAGLIDEGTATRIAEYEADHDSHRQQESRPGVAEAVVYLAAAVILVGVFVLASVKWSDFSPAVRIALASLSAVAALIVGAVLWGLRDPRLRRGAAVTWLAAAALCAATAAVSADEAGVRDVNVPLYAAGVLLAVSAALAAVSRRHPQIVSLAAGVLLLGAGVAGHLDSDASLVGFGLVAAGFGAVGLLLVERGALRPESSGRAFAVLLVVVGVAFLGFPPTNPLLELCALAAGGALVALSFWRRTLVYMGFGIAAIFIALVTAVLRHISDPALAAFALIIVGLLLLGGVLVVARLRSRVSAYSGRAL